MDGTDTVRCPECGETFDSVHGLNSHHGLLHGGAPKSGTGHKISDEALLHDIRGLAIHLGYEPSMPEYDKHGRHGSTTVTKRFGSWEAAKERAGVKTEAFQRPEHYNKEISNEQLKEEVARLIDEHGYISAPIMREYGEYTPNTYRYRFGNWNEALSELGFEITEEHSIGRETLVEVVRELGDDLDRTPMMGDIDQHTPHGHATVFSYFDDYDELLLEAGFTPRRVVLNCTNCGEEFSKKRSHVYERNFCSRECKAEWWKENGPKGEDHWNWKGGGPWDYGENWDTVREQILRLDQYRCQACGKTQEQNLKEHGRELSVHHVFRIKAFDMPEDANYDENLVTMCNQCHQQWEGIPIRPRLVEN